VLCQRCQERPATIHLTKVINYEKTELHLCEICAKAAGNELGIMIEPNFTFQNLIAGLLDGDFLYQQPGMVGELTCRNCGLTFTDFRNQGLLGCGECYHAFQASLEPLFRRVQGGTVHTGKVPRRTGGRVRLLKEMEQLKHQLQQAVAREEYEKAAQIRDEIRRLQQQL